MSSSISSFNSSVCIRADAGADASWRRWVVAFCATFFGFGGLLFALLLLIDPYDSARFPTLGIVGIDDHALEIVSPGAVLDLNSSRNTPAGRPGPARSPPARARWPPRGSPPACGLTRARSRGPDRASVP